MKIEIDVNTVFVITISILLIGIFFTINNQAHTNIELDINNQLIGEYLKLINTKNINMSNSTIEGYTHIKIDAEYSLFDIVEFMR